MLPPLKTNWNKLRRGALNEALEKLEQAFIAHDIDFYLVGAFARDVWISHLEHLPVRRKTLDVDFAIYIRNHADFADLKQYLVHVHGFIANKEPYRLTTGDGFMFDLIPFGGIEQNEEVFLEGNPPVELSVLGTKEVTREAVIVKNKFKVVTLPGLCILKLIAYSQKPDGRAKDLQDFYYLLENYFDIAGETLYEGKYLDLLEDDYVTEYAAARMMGRQMSAIIQDNPVLVTMIQSTLQSKISRFTNMEIDQMIEMNGKKDPQVLRLKLISEVLKGLHEV